MIPTHRFFLPAVELLIVGLFGCASTPLERALDQKRSLVSTPATLPRAVAIRVKLDETTESLYGTESEWEADILRVVEELDACARLVPQPQVDEADMTVTIHLSRSDRPAESDIQTTGALLDFLAWSTIPLLPLWIPDVDVRPVLRVRVERSLRGVENQATPLEAREHEAAPVATSYLDRRPFFSWPTIGAILVPPFIFSGTDPEHVEAEIGAWVREATAVQVADIVRDSRPKAGELLDDIVVKAGAAGPVLAFRPSQGLRRVVASVRGKEVGKEDRSIEEAEAAPRDPIALRLDSSAVGPAPSYVNVIAAGNRPGWRLRYTIRVPPETFSPPTPGGGRP
ncbi:MAG TPA: hypothetical protein VFD71_00935 [Planctomycetota bacterium]|nr:hypothetical protein [Planctomycetota bacterium]